MDHIAQIAGKLADHQLDAMLLASLHNNTFNFLHNHYL